MILEGDNITLRVKGGVSEVRQLVLFLGDPDGYSDVQKLKIGLENNFLLKLMPLTANKDIIISLDVNLQSKSPRKLTVERGWAPLLHDRTVI